MVFVDIQPYPFCIDGFEASRSNDYGQFDYNDDGDFDDYVGAMTGNSYNSKEYTYDISLDNEISLIGERFIADKSEVLIFENNIPLPSSQYGQSPWMMVNRYQAELYCKATGKRLPTNYEWYVAAQGTPDYLERPAKTTEACNIFNFASDGQEGSVPKNSIISDHELSKQVIKTGTAKKCISRYGAYDMIGNAWEWVEEIAIQQADNKLIIDLKDKNRQKISALWPEQGYIDVVDENTGHPLITNQKKGNEAFNLDYSYTFADDNCSGNSDNSRDGYGCNYFTAKYRGIMRGGSAVNGLPAGINRADLDDSPSMTNFTLMGFRCVKDI